MCSDCGWDWNGDDQPDEADPGDVGPQLCECGHDVELHDSRGCQVQSRTFRCKCMRTIEQLLSVPSMEQTISIRINELAEFCSQYGYGYAVHHQEWISKHERHSIDSDTLRCECGASVCFECAKLGVERCTNKCGGNHETVV